MSQSFRVGEIHSLTIDSLSYGAGSGVGRLHGYVIFVPFTAPGDFVRVQLTRVKKSYAEAELVELVQASSQRLEPPCPYFAKCGGCDWQHVNYQTQLEEKQKIITRQFQTLLGTNGQIHTIVPSPRPYHYRNRIQVHKNRGALGFLKRGSHDLVPVDQCKIAEPEISAFFPNLLKSPQFVRAGKYELLKNQNNQVVCQPAGDDKNEMGFSQVNSGVNELMVAKVLEILPNDTKFVFDLYAGNGNFSFPIAQKFLMAQVISVELNEKAHESAYSQARDLNLNRVTPLKKSVEGFLRTYKSEPPDVILLDPPRAGLKDAAAKALLSLRPKTVIYISCDPMTLQRDLRIFKTSWNMELSELFSFDMFPQTFHVELMAVLRPRVD
jgi:23S rRNA (uracil1939-C5)-methyltransferase